MERVSKILLTVTLMSSISWGQGVVNTDSLSQVVDSLLTFSKEKAVKVESADEDAGEKHKESKTSHSSKRDSEFPIFDNFKSKLTIGKSDTLTEDKTIIAGDVLIEGVLSANIKVYGGNVWIKSSGEVSGNILVSGGQIRVDPGAKVTGSLTEISLGGIDVKKSPLVDKWFEEDESEPSWDEDEDVYDDEESWEWEHKNKRELTLSTSFGESVTNPQNPTVRYNRQEGLFLPLRTDFTLEIGAKFRGYLGYGFGNKKMRYGAGLTIPVFTPKVLVDLSVYDRTTTPDSWRLSETENSLVAFLFGEDYLDYYEAQGVGGNLLIRPLKHGMAFRLGGYSEDHTSMPNVTQWGLFAKDRFRPGFTVFEGNITAATAHLELGVNPWRNWGDWNTYLRDKADAYLGSGISVNLDAEKTLADYSDTNFVRLRGTLNLGLAFSRDFILYNRTMFATSDQSLIGQRNNDLGGYGTLRGLRYREMPGDQSVLNNLELWIGSRESFLIDPYLVLFLDSGFARQWVGAPTDEQWQNFQGIRISDLRHSAGVSVMDEDGSWRLSVARELQNSNADWRFELRLQARL
ncbi:MAG: polymer-forming cytoskeletal protein [Lentisphaeria bacterium]|nr:polymer-forming cytoskeletal protein [Candidatus Neomarinimicrobiota bacterium]MCF7841627.1 polymer-forming cytoskeletal protein [Lentisphaeria bacterium]